MAEVEEKPNGGLKKVTLTIGVTGISVETENFASQFEVMVALNMAVNVVAQQTAQQSPPVVLSGRQRR